jgi:hypothetical protein
MIAVAEPRLDQFSDVGARPTRDAITLGIGATQKQRTQRCLLPFGQTRGPRAGPVAQVAHALRVVANDCITQRLTLHPSEAGCFGARHAF